VLVTVETGGMLSFTTTMGDKFGMLGECVVTKGKKDGFGEVSGKVLLSTSNLNGLEGIAGKPDGC
jgi:hypothetical protein